MKFYWKRVPYMFSFASL